MKTETNYYYLFPEYVGVFKTEKPIQDYTMSNDWFERFEIKPWLTSGVKYPFGEGDQQNIFKEFIRHSEMDLYLKSTNAFNHALNLGIKIDSERVEISHDCEEKIIGCKGCDCPKLAYFVPVEDKPIEEAQEQIIIDLIGIYNVRKLAHDPMDYWKDTLDETINILKSRFHITRK